MYKEKKECKYCQKSNVNLAWKDHDACLLARFYNFNDLELSNDECAGWKMWSHPEGLAKLNFRFEIVKEGTWSIWGGNDYRIKAYISDDEGKEKSDYVYIDKSFDFFWKNNAEEALKRFVDRLNQERNKGLEIIREKENKDRKLQDFKKSRPSPEKISEIKKEPTKINSTIYQKQATDLQNQNTVQLESLRTSPEENKAAIVRLQKINQELEKRKQAAKALEEKKILEKIKQQESEFNFNNEQINKVGKSWEQAKKDGNKKEQKRLNEEYLFLQNKQKALATAIATLKKSPEIKILEDVATLENLYDFNDLDSQSQSDQPTTPTVTITHNSNPDGQSQSIYHLGWFMLIVGTVGFFAWIYWIYKTKPFSWKSEEGNNILT